MTRATLFLLSLTATLVTLDPAHGLVISEDVESSVELEEEINHEIERIKARLREQGVRDFKKDRTPSSKKLPESAVQVLLQEDEPPVQRTEEHVAKLMILLSSSNFSCTHNTSSSCQRFEYDISPAADLSTVDFWFQRASFPSASGASTLSVDCALDDGQEVVEEGVVTGVVEHHQWSSLHLAGMGNLSQKATDLRCGIEVTDLAVNQSRASRPFLRAKEAEHSRRRRSTSDQPGTTCQPIPFELSFRKDIGWNDVESPDRFQARLCHGHCTKASSFHETVLEYAFQRNKTLKNQHNVCWATCCRPMTFSPLRVLHILEDENGREVLEDRTFTNMVVETCACG